MWATGGTLGSCDHERIAEQPSQNYLSDAILGGIETLAMGGGAAAVAFLSGFVLEPMLGNLQFG